MKLLPTLSELMDLKAIFITNRIAGIRLGQDFWHPVERANYVAMDAVPLDGDCPEGYGVVIGRPSAVDNRCSIPS